MEKRFCHNSNLRIIKDEGNKRIAEFVISDETLDRHNTIIPIKGWELENFNNNGIVGYQHEVYGSFFGSDPDCVIAKGTAFIKDDKLMGQAEFESEETTDNKLAEKIWKKIKFGTLKTTSVGFNPLEEGEKKKIKVDGEDKKIYHFGKRELLEFSIVNIPSNPNARKRTFETEKIFHKIDEMMKLEITQDEILERLEKKEKEIETKDEKEEIKKSNIKENLKLIDARL